MYGIPRKGSDYYQEVREAMEYIKNPKPEVQQPEVQQTEQELREEASNDAGMIDVPTINELAEFLDRFKREGVENIIYEPASVIGTLMFLHLMKKYKNDCIVVSKISPKNYTPTYEAGLMLSSTLKSIMYADPDLPLILQDCINIKANPIIIPVSLPAHQNMMIYRPEQNTMELFEPHGAHYLSNKPQLDEIIADTLKKFFQRKEFDKVFKREGVPEFKFIKPIELGLEQGFQNIESSEGYYYEKFQNKKLNYEGFCIMWSMFYLELVLRFPNKSGKELVEDAHAFINTKDGSERFLRHIGAYVEESEKDLKQIVKNFSFADVRQKPRERLSEEKEMKRKELFAEWNDFVEKQMREIIISRAKRIGDIRQKNKEEGKKKKGGEMVSSCCGGSEMEGSGNAWIEALKDWNNSQITRNETWCLPKKGSKQSKQVHKVMEQIKKGKKTPILAQQTAKKPQNKKEKVVEEGQTNLTAFFNRKK